MNILLLANHFDTGGITSYLLNLSRGLAAQGHKVIIISSGGNCVGLLNSSGVRHVRMNIRTKAEVHPKLAVALPRLIALIKEEQIDIIHAHTRVTQVMAQLASSVTGKPFVSTCHGYFKTRLFRRLFPCWGQGIIAISRGVQEHLINDFKVPSARVKLIANGIDIKSFLNPHDRQVLRQQWKVEGDPIIGIIARLSSVKGIDVLIAAMPFVLAEFPQSRLLIVGEGPEQSNLERLVEEAGLSARVRFEPIVNRTADILPIFDVFVMPSFQEGLGLSVMEAQAAGIPVIASNVGGLPDLIEDGKTGILVMPGKSDFLAQKIIALLKQPQQGALMAKEAKKQVQEKFSVEEMVNKTLNFYEQHTRR